MIPNKESIDRTVLESTEHWEENVRLTKEGKGIKIGENYCALCKLFSNGTHICRPCPLFEKSRNVCCAEWRNVIGNNRSLDSVIAMRDRLRTECVKRGIETREMREERVGKNQAPHEWKFHTLDGIEYQIIERPVISPSAFPYYSLGKFSLQWRRIIDEIKWHDYKQEGDYNGHDHSMLAEILRLATVEKEKDATIETVREIGNMEASRLAKRCAELRQCLETRDAEIERLEARVKELELGPSRVPGTPVTTVDVGAWVRYYGDPVEQIIKEIETIDSCNPGIFVECKNVYGTVSHARLSCLKYAAPPAPEKKEPERLRCYPGDGTTETARCDHANGVHCTREETLIIFNGLHLTPMSRDFNDSGTCPYHTARKSK